MTNSCLLLATFFLVLGTVLASSSKKENNDKDVTTSTSQPSKHEKSNETNLIDSDEAEDQTWNYENQTVVDSRRILFSKKTGKGKRPYMVYLQLTKESAKAHKYRGWLCGGVIVNAYYVLTSAACVEDADRFYIVSGTTKFVDSFDYKNDECVSRHRRKVVWKCIPKNYKFDFQDSIKWSSNDIAIVKVDRCFKFGTVEQGCEFAAELVQYNNVSRDLEKPGTKGYIAGWGSGNNFREGVYRRQHIPKNSKCLQEARVCIMDNEQCAKKWAQKFREIITQYMICTKDVMKRLSEICEKKYANCTDVGSRRQTNVEVPTRSINVDLGRHLRDPDDYTARRSSMQGGFCENDHGGPLLVTYQNEVRVVGVISACKIDPKTHSCHGPFLYTSVYRNRQFISCAIHKDVEQNCRRVFRSGITHEEWKVNWDNVDEDGVVRAEVSSETAEAKDGDGEKEKKTVKEKATESAADDDSNDSNEKKEKSDKDKKDRANDEGAASGSEPEAEAETEAEVKAATEKPSKKEKVEKHKSKSNHKTTTEDAVESTSQKDAGEIQVRARRQPKKPPASYESSVDEDVNEPDSE